MLKTLLEPKNRLKVSNQEYSEAYHQLLITKELQIEGAFFANKPYVNCLNGVVDVKREKLLSHSSDFHFKNCVLSKYVPGSDCPMFKEYLDIITNKDNDLKELIQVMLGYLLSHYNNSKVSFLLYGISHTGKSVLCNIIERVAGKANTANIELYDLMKPEYVASLSGKMLNVAPDLKNKSLRDVAFFKSLTSHNDHMAARLLYKNPTNIQGGETKMLFSSNHFLTFGRVLSKILL